MRGLAVVLSLAFASGVYGQAIRRGFGSVVFPGGTSSTTPTITRNFGSVVFPGGVATQPVNTGGPSFGFTPGFNGFNGSFFPSNGVVNSRNGRGPAVIGRRGGGGGGGRNNATPYVFAYPVFIGGGYDDSYAMPQPELPMQPPMQAPMQPQPQQPNVTVVFPPQQPPQQRANPMMIQPGPDGDYPTTQRQQGTIYEAPRDAADDTGTGGHYLVAFKDHTIYSAIAYWVDGETLHYFTTGNTHNQASISLIDRELTNRLNRELGLDFKLPPAK